MEGNVGEPLDEWNNSSFVGNSDSKTMLESQGIISNVKVEENGGSEQMDIGEVKSSEEVVGGRNNKRSIAERRGFDSSSNSMAQFRVTTPSLSSPSAQSTFLTIPPGLTPSALLDSPVMLPNSRAQESPTTGSFQFPHLNHENLMSPVSDGVLNTSSINANNPSSSSSSSGTFNTQLDHHHLFLPSSSNTMSQTPRDNFEFPEESPKVTALKNCSSEIPTEITNVQENMSNIGLTNAQQVQGTRRVNQLENRGVSPRITCNTSDDGYTWRKYGQKHVKGSEHPRSYYKCTQQNCIVKKKVERSPDGQVTEIVYKGAHNHPKTQPTRRQTMSANGYAETSEVNEGNIWRNQQLRGNMDVRDWRGGGHERTTSTSVLNEVSDPLSTPPKSMNVFESAELSSTLASRDDEDEDRVTEGSNSPGDDIDDCDLEPKKRRKISYTPETSLSSRTIREPRVVVQIESEIDILDDGYRWRKYGQKVVKGNPNPRSYYKCTSAECPVRKHVERASDNLKSVITTYEGKHNHEVPSANKTNGGGAGNQASASTSNGQSSMASPKSPKVSNLGMQVQDFPLQFERKPFIGNDYLRPNFLGNYLSDLRFGASSPMFDLKFPSINGSMAHRSLLMGPTQIDSGSFAPLHLPEFQLPMPLSMNLPATAGPNVLPLGDFHFNNLPLRPTGASSSHSSPPAIGDQQHVHDYKNNNNNNNNINSMLVKPKEEIKNEHFDHQNGASSTVHCSSIVENFPS